MKTLPKYVSFRHHGETSIPLPVEIAGAKMYCFALRANRPKVQSLIENTLNAAAPGEYQYDFVGNHVLAVFVYARRGTAPTVGWQEDRESALFVPTVQRIPATTIPKLLVWPAYVFIDSAIGMTIGREVLGYNKTQGTITVPDKNNDPAQFGVSTVIFRTLNANTQGISEPLISVTRTDRAQRGGLQGNWKTPRQLFANIDKELGPWTVGATVLDFLKMTLRVSVPIINLKQFRDIQDNDLACYQALAESTNQISLNGAGLLGGKYRASITPCDSHQIADDLGLQARPGGDYPVSMAFWIKLDFSIQPGKAVWTAPIT